MDERIEPPVNCLCGKRSPTAFRSSVYVDEHGEKSAIGGEEAFSVHFKGYKNHCEVKRRSILDQWLLLPYLGGSSGGTIGVRSR